MKSVIKKLWFMMLVLLICGGGSLYVEAATLSIPSDAQVYGKHAYKVYDKGLIWSEAEAYCEKLGGHLVTITSSGEQNFVKNLILEGERNSYWLGGYESDSGWLWVTGETFSYTSWAYGQPDDHNGEVEEDSLMMYRNQNPYNSNEMWGTWNDLKHDGTCDGLEFFGLTNLGFVCEWDGCYKLTLSDSTFQMSKGKSTYLTYTLTYNGNSVTAKASWKSSDTTVAKVSSKGKVVAVGAGTCTITCKAKGISKKVKIIVKPTKVSSVKASSKTKTSVTLKWKAQSGVAKYQIYMYDRDLEEYTRVKTVNGSANSAKISGLKKGKTYKFKVRAYVKYGSKKVYGSFSAVCSVKTKS